MSQRERVDTYYLAVCPECNKYLEYTIDAKVDYLYNIDAQDIDAKMKQAANGVIAEHNNIIKQKHSSRLVEYKVIEDSKTEKEAVALREEKISILKSIMSLV